MATARTRRHKQRRFSLAAALFPGFPAAEGCAQPQQCVPDSWLLSFREHHADAEVLAGLFTSCPAGRDYVLETAVIARLQLDTTVAQDPFQWLAQLRAVKQHLITRGTLRTTLSLTADETQASTAACVALLGVLIGASGNVHRLDLHQSQPDSRPSPPPDDPTHPFTDLLRHAGQTFTGLVGISIHNSSCTLPPLSHLPGLKWLQYKQMYAWQQGPADILSSIVPYLPQLTHLELDCIVSSMPWPLLFTTALTTHTLARLTLPRVTLDDRLVGHLQRCAPALRSLHVGDIDVRTDAHAENQWQVLFVRFEHDCSVNPFSCEQLARLPRTKDGSRCGSQEAARTSGSERSASR